MEIPPEVMNSVLVSFPRWDALKKSLAAKGVKGLSEDGLSGSKRMAFVVNVGKGQLLYLPLSKAQWKRLRQLGGKKGTISLPQLLQVCKANPVTVFETSQAVAYRIALGMK